MKQKILSLLVLLLTAASGAWADELTVYDGTETNAYVPVYGFYADAYLKCQAVYPATELAAMAGNSITSLTYYATAPASEAWTGTFQVHVIEVADATISSFNDLSTATLVYEGTLDGTQSTMTIPFTTPYNYQGGNLLVSVSLTITGNYKSITWGGEIVEGASVQGYNYGSFDAISATQRNFLPKTTFTYEHSNVEVTTNAASEGATFTEATFAMPAFDATAEYELVRDMGYKVAFSGVPTRARLAKDGNGKFHFADGLTFQLLDNIDAANPKDITSAEGITFMVGEMEAVDFEGRTFYQLNKETLVPLADFLADAHLGNYAICAVASTGEYDGSFSSDMITLFQGYEVTVPAGEFATFYKDEPLYADTETSADAVLYTIQSVSADQATLSAAIETAPSLTPLLIFNNSDQAKTFLLIPANEEPNLALTVAPEFQGTLTGTTIAASTDAQTNYALNGKQFVYVKNAIPVAANKCWLQIPNSEVTARNITLVFGDATGIDSMVNGQWSMDTWYDLNGRKLNGMPTKKGIYMNNGRKVVVK